MTTHLIYHAVKPGIDCPDGITSAAIAYSALTEARQHVTVAPGYYRKVYPEMPDVEIPATTNRIVILDFSYPGPWLCHWKSEGFAVEVLEHHADKFPWLENFSGVILDDKECGATLVWQRFHPGKPLPELLEHVRNRDIGLHGYYEGAIPESEAINAGYGILRNYLKSFPIEEQLAKITKAIRDPWSCKSFEAQGMPKIQERDRLIAECLPKTSLATIDGVPCAFYDFTNDRAIAPHYSVLGHQMCKYRNVPIAWLVDGNSNHLRSLSSFPECSRIAASKGGGGHPCASGWQS